MRGCISYATKAQSEQVSLLRCQEYSRSKAFANVDKSWVRWTEEDDTGTVLVAWGEAGQALATMRCRLICSREEAEAAEDCSFEECRIDWPCLMLERAATREEYRKTGLNSALRYHLLRLAIQWGIRHTVGVVVEGDPRTRLMHLLGYDFFPGKRSWVAYGVPQECQIQAAVLYMGKHGKTALDQLKVHVCGDALIDYPWAGEDPPAPKLR